MGEGVEKSKNNKLNNNEDEDLKEELNKLLKEQSPKKSLEDNTPEKNESPNQNFRQYRLKPSQLKFARREVTKKEGPQIEMTPKMKPEGNMQKK